MVIRKGKSQVTFVFQPGNRAQTVQLAGTFNDWQPDQGKMTRQKDGTYRKRLDLSAGQHRYKFFVDGEWVEDTEAEALVPNDFGTKDSLITVG